MRSSETPALEPEVALPADEGLPGLLRLFDSAWVWQTYCDAFGAPEEPPQRLRPRQLSYRPGEQALVSYVAERQWEHWVLEDEFAIELVAGEAERIFRYPDDPHLPGLPQAASALEAQQLIPRYVRLHPYRLRVEAVRYRPGVRAVLRHIAHGRRKDAGKATLFVRVMPPRRVDRLLAAAELAESSGFVLPRLAGCWPEGGVLWLTGVPGDTVRELIRKGKPPDPGLILENLAQLWSAPVPADAGRPRKLTAGLRRTQRLFAQVLADEGAQRALQRATDVLRPFAEAWRPSALAHNDFYDDQMLLTPTGTLALVDFEEIGPGDPLLDVGNFLAHLRWTARFRSGAAAKRSDAYRRRFRSAALERFGWDERELALREAFSLFRVATNPLRHLQRRWPQTTEAGLELVAEVAEGAP